MIDSIADDMIQLCEQLQILVCLLCEATIKPEPAQVERHYRNCHKTTGQPLQDVIAFAESFSPSGWRPQELKDPTDENMELPTDGSPPGHQSACGSARTTTAGGVGVSDGVL
jgi:hypothetical protein